MSNIYLTAFGTFGSPNGFTQSILLTSNQNTNEVKIKDFDLNSNAIELFGDSQLYAIRKEIINNRLAISYATYTYAKEKTSDRRGTFIGSALTFEKEIADENIITSTLNEFHQKLVADNTENQRLKVIHSNEFKVNKPQNFDKLGYNTRLIPRISATQSKNTLLVYASTDNNNLRNLFQKSLDLLDKYDSILFTRNKEVAEFVMNRGIFSVIQKGDFDQEIAKIEAERKKRIQDLIAQYQKNIENINSDKEKKINSKMEDIQKNEKKHQENANKINQAKDNLRKIETAYSQNIQEINSIIKHLQTGNLFIDDAKKQFSAINQKLKETLRQYDISLYISNMSSPTTAQVPPHQGRKTFEDTWSEDYSNNHKFQKDEIDKKKVLGCIAIISIILLGLSSLYFGSKILKDIVKSFFSSNSSITEQVYVPNTTYHPTEEEENTTSPYDNNNTILDFLNENDTKLVNKNLEINKHNINEVVKIIFKENPNDIGLPYQNREQEYSNLLFEQNRESFEIKSSYTNDTILISSLNRIPK